MMDAITIGNVISGLTLAAILWIGRTLHELASTVLLHDWRITQLEKPKDEDCKP